LCPTSFAPVTLSSSLSLPFSLSLPGPPPHLHSFPTRRSSDLASAKGAAKGAYVLAESSTETPEVILVATGTEVAIALEARATLEKALIGTRVVSIPCREWFERQTRAYRNKVLPTEVRARVSVEAATPCGRRDLIGEAGESVGIDHFGASADVATLYAKFGITPAAVVKAARTSIKNAKG